MSQGNTGVTVEVGALQECESTEADSACAVLDVLGRVSGKWSIAVLLVTTQGPVRFTELERQVKGISRRMLTLTLRNLERDGLLTRTVHPTVPPKVEYEATPMARELYDSLVALSGWAARHVEEIDRARREYDGARAAAAG